MAATPVPTTEVITNGPSRITVERTTAPTEIVTSDAKLMVFDINDPSISPANFDQAHGAPLRVLHSPSAKLDVSKRSHEDMGFWHRSVDHTEVIFCVKGALRWETEIGTHVLKPGEALVIPRGIAHRSALDAESGEENILLEFKIADDVEYVGPQGAVKS